MKTWKRITLVSFVLIGSALSFGYWSFSQIDTIFDDLNSSYGANTASTSLSERTDKKSILARLWTVATPTVSTSTEISITFPRGGDGVYMGCTYDISWQSPFAINSLNIALIDAGTKKASESIYSGLAETHTIETGKQYIQWKVGTVWPGEYYIVTSKVNGLDTEIKSETFVVNRTLENIDKERMATICLESGGEL